MKHFTGDQLALAAFAKVSGTTLYRGKVFQCGSYTQRDGTVFDLPPEDFDSQTLAAFEAVPNELEHFETVGKTPHILSGKLGRLVEIQREGLEVFGGVEIPTWLGQELGDDPLKVSLVFDKDKRVIACGLVLDPRISDSRLAAAFSASQSGSPEETNQPMNLTEAFAALFSACFGGKQSAGDGDEPVKPESKPTPVVFAKPDPAIEAARDKAIQERDEAIAVAKAAELTSITAFATTYVDGEAKAFRVGPKEREHLLAEVVQAIHDDNAGKVTAFSNGVVVEGPRFARIKTRQEARPAFDGSTDAGEKKVFIPGAKADETSDEEKKRLISFSGAHGAEAAKEMK